MAPCHVLPAANHACHAFYEQAMTAFLRNTAGTCADSESRSTWGFSKGAAAGIIIAAVVFGLLAGVTTGCAVIRCYTIYMHCQAGGSAHAFCIHS